MEVYKYKKKKEETVSQAKSRRKNKGNILVFFIGWKKEKQSEGKEYGRRKRLS